MKFFFPDSQDLVDPSFDFERERRSPTRVRQRDDVYAHEVFSAPVFDGLLVSKGIVDGFGPSTSRYTIAQRHRLARSGAHEFLRTSAAKRDPLLIMGDCGAFTYVREKSPPYSVDEVIRFYEECRFDLGISVDHVILEYQPAWDDPSGGKGAVPPAVRGRQEVTLELAAEFFRTARRNRCAFRPLGVAQGWSPKSYATSVRQLQKIGYDYIAVGGMVPLKTHEILTTLEEVNGVRKQGTRLHLLGVTRTEHVGAFARFGVASFDSTSPLRQAFKDDKDNYYVDDGAYTAIRIPQVEGNPSLQRRIAAGEIRQETARELEKACLDAMRGFDRGDRRVDDVVRTLRKYEALADPSSDHSDAYRATLTAAPWRACPCDVCRALKYHVILFRGAERNRRRGFHNVWVFYRRLQRQLAGGAPPAPRSRRRGARERRAEG